jgi:hypothetical protein
VKQKLRALFLIIIFTLSITVQTVNAATYTVDTAEEGIIQFNRSMAENDTDIKLDYNIAEDDVKQELYDPQYSLQDYVNSDYGYYNMSRVGSMPIPYESDGKEKFDIDYTIERIESPYQTQYVFDTIHHLITTNSDLLKASDYDKAAWAYDYIINHVTYDHSELIYSAYGALHDGTAVCQGYALLYYAFATELGLNCKIVSGTAFSGSKSGPHAWNMLELEGKWYCVDTTWGSSVKNRDYFLGLKKDWSDHILSSEYENYFDFATSNYINMGNSGYHGVLASVYNVQFDPLKKYTLSSDEDFKWMIVILIISTLLLPVIILM